MAKEISRAKVTGKTPEEIVKSINKVLASIYSSQIELQKRLNSLTKGYGKEGDSEVGSIKLVEDKKGSDKYKLVAKFKDGEKLLDAGFIDK